MNSNKFSNRKLVMIGFSIAALGLVATFQNCSPRSALLITQVITEVPSHAKRGPSFNKNSAKGSHNTDQFNQQTLNQQTLNQQTLNQQKAAPSNQQKTGSSAEELLRKDGALRKPSTKERVSVAEFDQMIDKSAQDLEASKKEFRKKNRRIPATDDRRHRMVINTSGPSAYDNAPSTYQFGDSKRNPQVYDEKKYQDRIIQENSDPK